MSRSLPKVSVVIPCYNAAPFLRETLRSVLNQTYPPLEVTVVDDGSEDDSAAIAESFGSPVRVIRQENQGESVARNRGIDEAKGDWIAFLDADDIWKPNKLKRQVDVIAPGVVCIHTNYFFFGAQNRVVDVSGTPPAVRYSIEHICVSNPIGCASSAIVPKELPTRFPLWTRYAEDLIYWLEVIKQGNMYLVPEPLTGYRRHGKAQRAKPAIETLWHKTVEEWLARNAERVGEKKLGEIRRQWLSRLVQAGRRAKWNREWEEYWAIRNYLSAYREDPEVKGLLMQRILPEWVYSFKDRVNRTLVSLTAPASHQHSSKDRIGQA